MSENKEPKIIPLNIVMSYPINWSFEQILRDLIQNFYDEAGEDRFGEEVNYNYKINDNHTLSLTISLENHPCDYEWFTFIGGSTKQGQKGKYIGKFGEGFKMCMLVLLRDYHITPRMESKDWVIEPFAEKSKIASKEEEMLAYRLSTREDDNRTVLTIPDIPIKYKNEVSEGLYQFFYIGNPLIGEKILATENLSIYRRTPKEIPNCSWLWAQDGIFFYSHLARAKISKKLVIHILYSEAFEDTRERNPIIQIKIFDLIYKEARNLGVDESYAFLVELRDVWDDYVSGYEDLTNWYFIICQLVRNVSKSKELVKRFKAEYTNLVYLEKKKGDRLRNKVIDEAKIWWNANREYGVRKVNPIFRELGARSIVDEYQEKQTQVYITPREEEQELVNILHDAFDEMYGSKYGLENVHEIVWSSGNSRVLPHSFATQHHGGKLRYQIHKAVISKCNIAKDKWYDAYTEYVDIVLHAYGTDKCAKVNMYLTELGANLIKNQKIMEKYNERWKQYWE